MYNLSISFWCSLFRAVIASSCSFFCLTSSSSCLFFSAATSSVRFRLLQESIFFTYLHNHLHGHLYRRKSIKVVVYLLHLYIFKLYTVYKIIFLNKRITVWNVHFFLCYAILSFDISNLDLFFASNGCLIKIKIKSYQSISVIVAVHLLHHKLYSL